MIPIYTDRRMVDHRPPSGHPEKPQRLSALLDHWEKTGRLEQSNRVICNQAAVADLARVHAPAYLKDLEEAAHTATDDRPTMLDPDTFMGKDSRLAALLAAGSAVAAVERVMKAEPGERVAFCAVRPPGHHARPKSAMGFCLYATVSVAAAHARDVLNLDRILIVDFDVHHGNGTQEIFYEDDRVGFLSIHRYPFYPGSGAADETGRGRGLGFTWNVPLPGDTKPKAFHDAFGRALEKAATKMRPQLVLVSAGFDAHQDDPVGGLGLESGDFGPITKAIVNVAKTHAKGRLVSMLEGGYHIDRLVESATIHLDALRADTRSA